MRLAVLLFTSVFLMLTSFHAHAQIGGRSFTQEYVYDFAKQGGAVGAISLVSPANALPQGGIVTSMYYKVVTAFTSGGSATVALGDAASGARYKSATAYNDSTYAANFVAAGTGVPILVSSANIANVSLTVATAALTAGKVVIVVSGYIPRQ